MNESESSKGASRPSQVQSVARALTIVEMLGSTRFPGGVSLAQVAQELGVSKSTAHALLQTLKQFGFVTRVLPGPRYLLGMALMRLGEQVKRRMPITEAAQPHLESLAAATGCTARLVVADNGYPLYVSRVEGEGAVQFTAQVGRRERPHSTGVGKIILASMSDEDVMALMRRRGMERITPHTITDPESLLRELEHIREVGYALDRGEEAEGIMCVAAGLTDPSGHCVGAISISGLSIRMNEDRIEELSGLVRDHARRLSDDL